MENNTGKGSIDRFLDRIYQAGKKETPAFDRNVEVGVESSLFLGGLAKAIELSQDQFYTIGVTQKEKILDNRRLAETIAGDVGGIRESTQRLASVLSQFADMWTDAYRKSKPENYTVTSCNDDGCSTSTRTYFVTYWDEPIEYKEMGLTHEAIEYWRDTLAGVSTRLNYLASRYGDAPSFAQEESPYELTLNQIQANNPDMLRLIGFGGALTVYALYEDIVGKLVDSKALRFNNIKRRSVLKIGGLWAALGVVENVRLSMLKDNEEAFRSSQTYTHDMIASTPIDSNEVYRLYMGTTASEEEQLLRGMTQVVESVLSRDTTRTEDYEVIHPQLEQLKTFLTNHAQQREYVFADGIVSEAIGHAMRSVYIDDAVRYFVGERNLIGYTAGLAQVGVLGATLVGASVSIESIIALLNKLKQDRHDQ